jgi:hypothetical protein
VVVEIILQDGGRLHVIEPRLDLHQGKELNLSKPSGFFTYR